MKQIEKNGFTKLVADEGKLLRQIDGGLVMGKEVYLGVDFTGAVPKPDVAENYEEIDIPTGEETDE